MGPPILQVVDNQVRPEYGNLVCFSPIGKLGNANTTTSHVGPKRNP
jgi:hypothetical protein